MEMKLFKSADISKLATALSKAQGQFKHVEKDCINPFFHSKYASLSSINNATREPLSNNGLSISQFPCGGSGKTIGLTTILMHASGEYLGLDYTMEAKDVNPQSMGSCLTYMRRYSKSAVLDISTEEDDDGNAATGQNKSNASSNSRQSAPANTKHSKPDEFVSPISYSGASEQKALLVATLKALGINDKEKMKTAHTHILDAGTPMNELAESIQSLINNKII